MKNDGRLTVRLPEETIEALKGIGRNVSVSEIIRDSIEQYLDSEGVESENSDCGVYIKVELPKNLYDRMEEKMREGYFVSMGDGIRTILREGLEEDSFDFEEAITDEKIFEEKNNGSILSTIPSIVIASYMKKGIERLLSGEQVTLDDYNLKIINGQIKISPRKRCRFDERMEDYILNRKPPEITLKDYM